MFSVTTSEEFLRQARKFFKKHPDLKARFASVFVAFKQDPFQSGLGLLQNTALQPVTRVSTAA